MRIKKSFRMMLAAAIVAGTFAVMPLASAEVKEYEGFGEYVMSDFETPDVAKQRAKARAEQNAMEQAGVYLESRTEVVNARITRDEIKTITNGILNVINIKYDLKPIVEEGGSFLITAKVIATIDTDGIENWLKRDSEEKEELVKQNKELIKINTEQEREIDNLKQQIAKVKNDDERTILKTKIESADRAFLAKEKIEEGIRLYYAWDTKGAKIFFEQAIEIDPSCAEAYRWRGSVYWSLSDYAEAVADFTSAIKLSPHYVDAYLARGKVLSLMGARKAAIEDFNTAISINPKNADAYTARAYALGNTFEQRIADLTIAIQLDPENDERYSDRAGSYNYKGSVEHDRRKLEKALVDYTKAIDLNPSYWPYYEDRGDVYDEVERYDEAISDYTIAIQKYLSENHKFLVPGSYDAGLAELYHRRASTYQYNNQYAEAIADYTILINISPAIPDFYYTRSRLYELIGDSVRAEMDLTKARELDPGWKERQDKLIQDWEKWQQERGNK